MKLAKRIGLVLVLLTFTFSCAGNIDLKSPTDRFMVAQEGFNVALKSYLRNYQLADSATRAEWNVNIWPWFLRADKALSAWDAATTDINKERAYLAVEDILFDLLRKYKIKMPEEGGTL